MNEQISRLMDGEIDASELDGVCAMLKGDAAMATWNCYHTIGDALRGETPVTAQRRRRRVARKLTAEPTVLAPRRSARRGPRRGRGPRRRRSRRSPSSAGPPIR